MSTPSTPSRSATRTVTYLLALTTTALASIGVMALWRSIMARKTEAQQHVFQVVSLDETIDDPAVWGQNYPRQYESYRRTVDTARTRHGGSEAFQKLDEDPRWRVLFKGYAFAVDYREERGHAYMLHDQEETLRVTQFKQPGACLHCHASMLPAYRETGRQAGVPDALPHEQVMRGFERVCAMPYQTARHLKAPDGDTLIQHPVSCLDCHDPQNMRLRITRPGLLNGLQALCAATTPLPHLPSIMRWRAGNRARAYDVNQEASRQEMRALVCAQCHVEYYFKKPDERLTYPWHNGIQAEEIEAYYDQVGHVDWQHAISAAPVLKAQHPEFELWSQGVHARSGVACADCHMPYMREGAVKISSHHVRSPLLNSARACQTCHKQSEAELVGMVEQIQDRTRKVMLRAEDAIVALIQEIATAAETQRDPTRVAQARALQRNAQWRLDFVAAENAMGFHAPQETTRLLAEAIDFAHTGRLALTQP